MRTAAVLIVVLLLAACSGGGEPNGSDGRLRIAATTTVVADLVRHVAGDNAEVTAVVPAGGEVHTFDPTPSDLERVASADAVFANGLGLDEWVTQLVSDAGSDALVVELAEDLSGVTYREGADAHEGDDNHGTDPHVWLNPAYAALYVDRIADELSKVDPGHASAYADRAAAYRAELEALDAEVHAMFEAIPADDRRVVSYHDAFGYFADAYGLEIIGTVTDAPGQDPSAGEIARLIDEIRDLDARAILAEAQFPVQLAERIADDAGIQVVTELHTDSVGPAPLDSFVAILRHDAEQIAEALR